jgi:hypothetical protein
VLAPSDATVPVGLAGQLTCTLSSSSAVKSGPCPLYWPTIPAFGVYTATVTQNDGVTSPPVTVTVP